MRIDPVTDHMEYLRLRNFRPRTLQARRDQLLRFARALCIEPDETLLAVTREDLMAWQQSMVHLSPNYRSTSASHLRAFYQWAVLTERIERDPSVGLVAVRLPPCTPRPIGEDDLHMAINCAPPRLRAMLVLAAYEGLRACEIAGLMRHDICDTADPPVLFVNGKGGRQRVVPLSERTLLELRAHGLPVRGFVFPRGDGQTGGNTASRVSRICNDYLRDMGITDVLHSLRHRFGTQVYRVSNDLRMTSEVMGHASPSTTAGYVAWSSAAAVAALAALPGADLSGLACDPYPGDVRSSA